MKNLILLLVMCLAVVQPAGAQDWKSFTTTFNTGPKGHLAIAFDNNDSLCVAYRNGNLVVSKYTGSGWSNMDPFGAFNTVDPYWISLKFNSNNIPYVCFLHPGVRMNVMECINGTWTSLGGSNGVTTATISNPQFVFGPNDTLFACYTDPGSNNFALPFVKKYKRSTDTWVGTATITSNKSEPLRLTTDSSKTPYIAYRDNTQNAQIVVKKYDGNTNSWVNIGSASGISHRANTGLAIAFDSKDSLYVAYGDNTVSNKLIVLKNRGNTWVVVGDSLGNSAGSAEDISMMADDDGNIYVCYIDGANNTDPTVKKYDGSSWTTVGSEGFANANSISEFGALAMDSMKNLYLSSQRTSTSIEISRYREKTTCRSNNPTSGPYYWDNGDPDDVTNAVIAAFNADPGSFTCNDLVLDHYLYVPPSSTYTVHGDITDNVGSGLNGGGTVVLTKNDTATLKGTNYNLSGKLIVEEGTTLFIDSNTTVTIDSVLELAGDLSMHDNATLDISSGKLLLNGTTAQTLNLGQTTNKFVTVDTMELDNSAGASFGFGVIYIRSEYQPTSGTLASNNRLRLLSDTSGSARIAAGSSSGGYITGNIVGRLYIPGGRRAFRFLSHAAIDTKPLNQLTDNIDITGQGGSTNGFTTTLSNAPSAFYFDVNTGDNSTAGNNPGWKAFTSATTTSWAKGQVMRVLIRGAKGEGLTTTTYTPSGVTLDMYEQVNQGDQTVTLTKGANTDFVLVGNPFPSQIQLNTVARGSNVGANFYIWDPSQGVRGGYTSHMFSSSYVLPQWGAFVTTVSANTNNTMVFEEADKTDGTPASQFKVTGSNHLLELSIDDTAYHWDRLLLSFDQDGYAVQDKLDAVKLNNPGLDFYTVSKDGTDLSIDVRPMQDQEIIPLGVDVWHNGGDGTFTISAKELNLSAGDQLIFYDKYLNQQEPITDTFSYTFTVSSVDSMSGGKNRFQIGVSTPTAIASAPSSTQTGQVQVYPNPAQDEVNVVFKQVAGKATLALSSVTGKIIYKKAVQGGTGRETIQLTELPPGIYIVELKGQNISYTQKLIKQ